MASLLFLQVVVKSIINIEEVGQDNYEVRIGVYNHGIFDNWKVKFSHPIATKEFIKLFDDNKDMYDSVYSMILAKNLPDVPDGVDINNLDVQRIVTKIRDEAGLLVSEHALIQANERIAVIMKPITERIQEIKMLKKSILVNESKVVELEKQQGHFFDQFLRVIADAEKELKKVEQFWVDDPRELRGKHQDAVNALSSASVCEENCGCFGLVFGISYRLEKTTNDVV